MASSKLPQLTSPKAGPFALTAPQDILPERPVRSTSRLATRSAPLDDPSPASPTESKTLSTRIEARDESLGTAPIKDKKIVRAKQLSSAPKANDNKASSVPGPNDLLTNKEDKQMQISLISSLLFESPPKPEQSVDIVIVELGQAPNIKPVTRKNDSLDEGKKKNPWGTVRERYIKERVIKNLQSHVRTRDLLTKDTMLPSALPEARILRYSVCQATTAGVPSNPMPTEEGLLPSLNAKRDKCPNRPIILIGHAFGGIVIEQALIAATENDLSPIWGSITGIVFLSTPFSCSNAAQSLLSHQLEKSAGVPRLASKINEAWFGPKSLKDIHEKFIIQVNKAKVPLVCFYEEDSTEVKLEKSQSEKILIVGEAHGTMKDFPKVGLSTDFFHVGSFWGPTDPNYRFLLDVILRFVRTHQLLEAAKLGHEEVVQSLLDKETNANLQDRFGQTALHRAVKHGRYEMVRLLLGKGGAKIGQRDNEGMTAIHIAVEEGHKDIVLLLLQKGADIKAKNLKGQDARRLAKLKQDQNPEIKDLIRHRPLIEGPSSKSNHENTKRDSAEAIPPGGVRACKGFQATVAEFYYDDKERRVLEQPPVYEVIKSKGPDIILEQSRPKEINEIPVCKWYHIPTNNMAWVQGLFTKIGFQSPSSIWAGQKHDSSFPHSRFFRPHCRKVRPRYTETEEELIVLFMPYLSYEIASRQAQMAKIIRKKHRRDENLRTKFYHLSQLMDQQLRQLMDQMRRAFSPLNYHQKSYESDSEASASGSQHSVTRKQAQPTEATVSSKSNLEHAVAECSDSSESGSSDSESGPDLPSEGADVEMIEAYLDHQLPLHVRRTLDQSYYYMLSHTKKRDEDQVVRRHTKRSDKNKDPKIVMVDQLWLWIIPAGGQYKSDIVISSFPQGWRQDPFDKSSLVESILNYPERPPITSGYDLCSLITTCCANIFDRSRAPADLQLLEIFEISIGRVANKETKLFGKFRDASRKLSKLSGKHDTRERAKCLNTLPDITKEARLLEEIKDIRDEIKMILMVLHDQKTVLTTAISEMEPSDKAKHSDKMKHFHKDVSEAVFAERYQMVDMNIKTFEKMKDHAEGAHDALNHLLDLKQKQANAWEARFAREGAQEAANQGKTILVFTVVTIIFLPLSFMATFFALSIAQFPKDSSGMTSWQLHQVSQYLFGISIAVSVPFIVLAFSVNQMVGLWEKHVLNWLKDTWKTLWRKIIFESRPRTWRSDRGRRPSAHDRGEDEGTDEERKAKTATATAIQSSQNSQTL